MTEQRNPYEELDAALERVIRDERQNDMAAVWERLDMMEEMVSIIAGKLEIDWEAEGITEVKE